MPHYSRALLFIVLVNMALSYQPDFKLQSYLGVWYEMARSKSMIFEKGKDITAEYGNRDDGRTSVLNTETLANGNQKSITGYAVPAGDDAAHFKVYFTTSWFMRLIPGDYRVMATDYKEYSIVYSYSKILWFWEFKVAWILSRDPHMSQDRVTELLADLEKLTGMSPDKMIRTPQDLRTKIADPKTDSTIKTATF